MRRKPSILSIALFWVVLFWGAVLLVILGAKLAFGAERLTADPFSCQNCSAQPYDLELRLKPLEPILPMGPASAREAHGWAEQMAYLADHGNRIWAHVRETQDRLAWYLAILKPHGSWDTVFTWARGQTVCLVLADSSRVCAEEVLVSYRGEDWAMMGEPRRLDFGLTLSFADMRVRFPREDYAEVFLAFPRHPRWDDGEVVKVEMEVRQ